MTATIPTTIAIATTNADRLVPSTMPRRLLGVESGVELGSFGFAAPPKEFEAEFCRV